MTSEPPDPAPAAPPREIEDAAAEPAARSAAQPGDWIPAAARALALAALVVIPLRILAQGYLPGDDALRHAAKAVSGRDWSEILLLRPEITLDQHPGWHAILGALHEWLGFAALDLVLFAVVALFALYSLGPVLLLRRPEAWLLALALLCIADPVFVQRLMLGRPYLLASAIVPLVLLLWPRLVGPAPSLAFALFAALAALATWIHGGFYLLALPVLALAGAREWRAAARLAAAFACGVPLGALLTGHPVGHLGQTLMHGYLALGSPKAAASLVTEFQAFEGRPAVVAAFLGLAAWRSVRREGRGPLQRDPAAVMAVGGWALGFLASRFWIDWAAPALLALAAVEFERAFERHAPAASRTRLAGAAGAALLLLLVTGADLKGRWSDTAARAYLSRDNPEQAPWLPGPGGVAYSVDMGVFYSTFFRNPDAPWKYVLGYEPALMPVEDFRIFSAIRASKGSTDSYLPWLRRMRPVDRLYVRMLSNQPPPIPGLEWSQPAFALWAGRLPASPPPPAPPGR